jgi:hypothetical protein
MPVPLGCSSAALSEPLTNASEADGAPDPPGRCPPPLSAAAPPPAGHRDHRARRHSRHRYKPMSPPSPTRRVNALPGSRATRWIRRSRSFQPERGWRSGSAGDRLKVTGSQLVRTARIPRAGPTQGQARAPTAPTTRRRSATSWLYRPSRPGRGHPAGRRARCSERRCSHESGLGYAGEAWEHGLPVVRYAVRPGSRGAEATATSSTATLMKKDPNPGGRTGPTGNNPLYGQHLSSRAHSTWSRSGARA